MTPQRLQRELADLDLHRGRLELRRAGLADALDTALKADRFDSNVAGAARSDLASVVARLRDVEERHAALTALLPTPEQMQQAARECKTLLAASAIAAAEFDAASAAFRDSLDLAERDARRVAVARTVARHTLATVTDTANAAGLSIAVPESPALTPARAQVAQLQALVIGECVYDQPEALTERDLSAARAATETTTGAVFRTVAAASDNGARA